MVGKRAALSASTTPVLPRFSKMYSHHLGAAPTLTVGFNGNSFDLPVLRYRSMLHQVSAPGLAARSYFNRYTEDALDLCDALSSFDGRLKIW
jgi:predicted PolB exonuclease-like 3'-5' exonuclease